MYNSFGLLYRFTTWGESHGEAIGVVLDGVPSGHRLDLEHISDSLARRRPGSSRLVSGRREPDEFRVMSGLYDGVTTGAPVAFQIMNKDADSSAYEELKDVYRPGHADFSWDKKFGIRDHRGGGRSSARETAGRVIAGAVARQLLPARIQIQAQVIQVGDERNPEKFEETVLNAKQSGDSVGAVVQVQATGVMPGLGEPLFEKLDARLAYAMMSIPAVKAVEIGSGVQASMMSGSEHNDPILPEGFSSNHAGGILGGVSNGDVIDVRLTLKPTSSIFMPQTTINRNHEPVTLKVRGRHDPCVGLRAPVIAEAMMACVLYDFYQLQKLRRVSS